MYAKLKLIVLLSLLVLVMPVYADPSPEATVQRFYEWYLDYAESANPLVEGAYRASDLLSDQMIAHVDDLIANQSMGFADPFLCAQDIPQSFSAEVMVMEDAHAEVLLSTFFAGNPVAHNSTVKLIRADVEWLIDSVVCGEQFTPRGVTESFYSWYLDQVGYDEASGEFRNPLVEGTYRNSDLLSEALIVSVDEIMADPPPGFGDPFLCAQDIPVSVVVETLDADTMIVHEYFGGNPVPNSLMVELEEIEGQWQLSSITCGLSPEAIAELVYSQAIMFQRHDFAHRLERTPFVDWGYPWSRFMSEGLLDELAEAYGSEDGRRVDPVLCAQDLPERVSVEAVEMSDDTATLMVSGDYPAGPDAYSSYELALAEMELMDGQWKLVAITCAP